MPSLKKGNDRYFGHPCYDSPSCKLYKPQIGKEKCIGEYWTDATGHWLVTHDRGLVHYTWDESDEFRGDQEITSEFIELNSDM